MRFSVASVAESRGSMPVILKKSMIVLLVCDDNFHI